MGKSLIIKGADFSDNCIQRDYVILDYIAGSDTDGVGIVTGLELKDGYKQEIVLSAIALTLPVASTHQCYTPSTNVNINCTFNAWLTGTSSAVRYGNESGGSRIFNRVVIGDGEKHTLYWSPTKVMLDSAEIEGNWSITNIDNRSKLGLDCYTNANNGIKKTSTDNTQLQIHRIKVWDENDNLILHAIPVKRIADDVVCFFDVVSGDYFVRNDNSTPIYGTL